MEIERLEEKGVTVVAVRGVINFGESARQFSSYLADLLDAGCAGSAGRHVGD